MRVINQMLWVLALLLAVGGSIALCAHAYDRIRLETLHSLRVM